MNPSEKDYESIVGQIKKVKTLAENGIGGEQENAKILLEKLLKKYKITLDELVTEEKTLYKFKFKTAFEKKILFQCIGKFAPSVKYFSEIRDDKGKIRKDLVGVELTKIQFLDVQSAAKFYVQLFAKELELFYVAFISKHDIFREKDETDTDSESSLTPEEIEAIIHMMNGLSDKFYIPSKLQIEAKN